MKNRSGIFRGRLILFFVAFLALPLFGWTILPGSASSVIRGDSGEPFLAAQDSPAGNVEQGQDLFMGRLHFENGGPPCMGCHNVGSNGILGGGALGPDLTNVSTKRSPVELDAILSNSGEFPAPVMQPIYAEHPLTAQEQADLLAFLAASVGQAETNREWLVIGISLFGFLAAVVAIEFIYHRRLHGVRRPLVRRAHSKKA